MSDLQKQMIEFSTMDLVEAVASAGNLDPLSAMEAVYRSPFFKKLQDPETGLYRESPAYLLNRFKAEGRKQSLNRRTVNGKEAEITVKR